MAIFIFFTRCSRETKYKEFHFEVHILFSLFQTTIMNSDSTLINSTFVVLLHANFVK